MHELTHLQTNFSASAVAPIALHSRLLHLMPQERREYQPLSQPVCCSTVRQEKGEGFPKADAEARRSCGLQVFSGLETEGRDSLFVS